MRKLLAVLAILAVTMALPSRHMAVAKTPQFKLGNEVLIERFQHLITGKRVGLVTNQSGVNSLGVSTIDVLVNDPTVQLTALYGPEHGIDGKAKAGAYVESYTHPTLNIPVYSLYGATRTPTAEMLQHIDVLLFDVQDVGSRTYTYMSTMNYAMKAAARDGKPIIILDRPNPVGGQIVDGPVLEEPYETFVGVDTLPMAHGMTAGELARFFNREINADLTVIPMQGYTRDMVFQDTGLTWVATSPNIPDIDSVFGYMATGLGEGTGIYQGDKFKWIGGKGIDANRFAQLLNSAGLPGVRFVPEMMGSAGGVRLQITDYRRFNPARTGFYAMAYAKQLNNFKIPGSGTMFEKIMGTNQVGTWLAQGLSPQQLVARYTPALEQFKRDREKYLIYGYFNRPGKLSVVVNEVPIFFDSEPFIDQSKRTIVPLRAIVEALGAQVEWHEATSEITVVKGDQTIKFKLWSKTAFINGVPKQMDTVPVIRNARTMVPVRYISEFLGATVDWTDSTRSVTVDYTELP